MRIPPKLQPWFDARRRLGLSHAIVQMARELGMNPSKLGKLVPSAQQQWKVSLPEFVAHCYEKRFGRRLPETVRSLEQMIVDEQQKKEVRRAKRALNREAEGGAEASRAVATAERVRDEA
jgi:hypothetical protein